VLFLAIATNLSIRKLETDHREGQFQQRLLATQRDQVQAFSAFVAHELLTPLARMGRSAEMLARDNQLPERASKRVFDLKTWAFEAGKLVEVFLNTASLQSGRAMVKPVATDLAAWLDGVKTELTLNYPQANLHWQLAPATQHASLDPLLAKLALENIVINALKYAGAQSAVVIQVAADNHTVVISVDDSGPGLAPAQYTLVGQAALLRQPTQEQPGFGLGLSLVAHIAQAHGGDFSASARQPNGVRWMLRLAQAVSDSHPATNA
jgi:K+-sensing histidine kinase KdpD